MGSTTSQLQQTHDLSEKESMRRQLSGRLAAVQPESLVPKSLDGSVSPSVVKDWETDAANDPKIKLSRTILSHVDFRDALASRTTKIGDVHVFNNELDFKTDPITNQKSSGRCWLFATTNVLRYSISKKLKLGDFQLSQVSSQTMQRDIRLNFLFSNSLIYSSGIN